MSKNEEENLDEWYVLFDGYIGDEGKLPDPNAVAFPGHMKDEAFQEFDDVIKEGLANKDSGLYIVKLSNVREDQYDSLSDEDLVNIIVLSDFEGFESEVVKKHKTGVEDWHDDALSVSYEHLEKDADGYVIADFQ